MKNKIMDEPMVRKGIKERLGSRVMALVGLAVLYGVLGRFISLGLDDRPAVCWSLMGVLGISFVSALEKSKICRLLFSLLFHNTVFIRCFLFAPTN